MDLSSASFACRAAAVLRIIFYMCSLAVPLGPAWQD